MKISKLTAILILAISVFSCKKDDDGGSTVELRDPLEVSLENDQEIKEFLETHFYNYEEFENPSGDFDYKVKIDTIAGDNADKKPLLNYVSFVNVKYQPSGTEDEVDHKLYYFVARQGEGKLQPTTADSTLVRYEGALLNGSVFDERKLPYWFDIPGDPRASISGLTRGITEFLPFLKESTGYVENGDGTLTFENYGIGAVIIPSGLAYFGGSGSIPAYAPIIFKVDMLSVNIADHDGDGVPSYIEDIDMDGWISYRDLGDDTDGDGIPNYLDTDDDGDGTLTKNEYDIKNNATGALEPDGIADDTDGDGIPDYLDNE